MQFREFLLLLLLPGISAESAVDLDVQSKSIRNLTTPEIEMDLSNNYKTRGHLEGRGLIVEVGYCSVQTLIVDHTALLLMRSSVYLFILTMMQGQFVMQKETIIHCIHAK